MGEHACRYRIVPTSDMLSIPKRLRFVLGYRSGAITLTALTFAPEKTAAWYLSHAGGTNATANRKGKYSSFARTGPAVGRHSGGWRFDVDTSPPGSTWVTLL